MIAEYIRLLESFKQYQISKIIDTVNAKVFETLKSPHFNPRIRPYFKFINQTGEPFTYFELDPDNISQIKKLINALYHARLAFIDLEQIEITDKSRTLSDLKLLLSKTTHEAYQASYLATHLDVDVKEMFSEELALILPLIDKLTILVNTHTQDAEQIAKTIQEYPVSHTLGDITGTAIQQLRPNGGDYDYKFLTQFSAILPSYIEKLTDYVKDYSSQVLDLDNEPTLNKAKLDELQNTAIKLLYDLENLKGNSLFMSLKALNYIHIISHVITLSMSSLEQMGHLTDSSQDLIRKKLAQLKYEVLPTLFGLADKIEDNAMVKPGTLSIPLMEKIKPLYDLLIYYASKPVNFKEKGEELLSIEDSRFLELRLELTYKRIDVASKALFKIEKAEEAYRNFYKILDNPTFKNLSIHELPPETKNELIIHYKLIKPYMRRVDINLHNILIDSLKGGETILAYLGRPLRWLNSEKAPDHISRVLAQQDFIKNAIAKHNATQQFHIDLNMDLIQSVQKQTNLVLFPYSAKTNVFIIDEAEALGHDNPGASTLVFQEKHGQKLLTNPDALTADQALDLSQWYRNKRDKFMVARVAYNNFIHLLKANNHTNGSDKVFRVEELDHVTRMKCRNLYNLFQPYFINGVPPQYKTAAINFDKYLVHSFSGEPLPAKKVQVDLFEKLDEHFQNYFTSIDLKWGKQSRFYLLHAREKYAQENEAAPLEHDINDHKRAHYVIQHTHYSKAVREFREAVNQVTSLFNQAMQAQLQPRWGTVPFPQVEDKHETLTQSKQTVALKRIFNAIYHTECILAKLESLNNESSEYFYVLYLIQAYGHISEIIQLSQNLLKDPHFSVIARELIEKSQSIFSTIQENSEAYQMGAQDVPYNGDVQFGGLWYTLNAFYISPKHIRSLRNNTYMTPAELDSLHYKAKQATVIIETLIKNSNSYFKLFLQAPNMLLLYRELTNKLNEFINTSHDTAMTHLDQMRAKIFTPMLLEADMWEDRLGLIPGSISGPMKSIIDEYYKGLLAPLELDSKTHISLVCDRDPLAQRTKVSYSNLDNAGKYLDKLEQNYIHIKRLHEDLKTYQDLLSPFTAATPQVMEIAKKQLISSYKNAYPKLMKLKTKIEFKPEISSLEKDLDILLNAELKEYQPKIEHIKSFAYACYNYYVGQKATYMMQFDTAREKLGYLTEQQQLQEAENLLFVKKYTEEAFDDQLKAAYNRHIGLQFIDDEYRDTLNTYLLQFRDTVINEAQTAEDINLAIKNALETHTRNFEEANFAKYYHMDTVQSALNQFKAYFTVSDMAVRQNNSVFESVKTLKIKTEKINKLIKISENKDSSIEERLDLITRNVKKLKYEKIILAHHKEDTFSFLYLKQCFYYLLEALSLYTPTRQKLFNNLNHAVDNQPGNSYLALHFGLFAPPKTPAPKAPTQSTDNNSAQPS